MHAYYVYLKVIFIVYALMYFLLIWSFPVVRVVNHMAPRMYSFSLGIRVLITSCSADYVPSPLPNENSEITSCQFVGCLTTRVN